MERCFALHPNRRNPYAYALLLGEMRAALNAAEARQIQLRCADAADFLERQPGESFTGFSLSNILDGTNRRTRGDYSLRCNMLLHLGRR